jgi:hypothetical protein
MADPAITHVDEPRLERDLEYRFTYLTEFIGFGREDITTIQALAPHLGPLVPALVDAVYVKLFKYDATKRHFVPRQSGYEGAVPADLDSLTLDHEQIRFRKAHLTKYLTRLVTGAYDRKMVAYLDFVGRVHTSKVGSTDLHVPIVQMNALMGFVSDALLAAVMGLDLPAETKARAVRSLNKLLWLQNDLIVRHYAA